jgi:hypothetical protein
MSHPKPSTQAPAIHETPSSNISESLFMNTPINSPAHTTPADASTHEEAKQILAEQAEDALMAKLRIPQSYADAIVGVKKPLLTVAVRKPNKNEFFRVHPSHFLDCCLIEDKTERENFFVLPEVVPIVSSFVEGVRLHFCVTRQDVVFLWPVKLPREDRRGDAWRKSAADCASLAQDRWVRITADMNLGAYQPYVAMADLGDPKWPEESWSKVFQLATRDRMIESEQHPLIRRLLGQE